ncbi:hypothetical protein SAMN05421740_10465 [Parapedobacter koreensis]|uniref:Uncharacterized protein n=1 Tax=Parapedobacter koreensis TaxID=332977 RepID=A0A1H7NQ17_9SPHI|nr:hypothetical protein SAMN05421740_10465 [Parapedobacter koreensis]
MVEILGKKLNNKAKYAVHLETLVSKSYRI